MQTKKYVVSLHQLFVVTPIKSGVGKQHKGTTHRWRHTRGRRYVNKKETVSLQSQSKTKRWRDANNFLRNIDET